MLGVYILSVDAKIYDMRNTKNNCDKKEPIISKKLKISQEMDQER